MAAQRSGKRKKTEPEAARLLPPRNGAVVRMYRIGHGDCFLLAFPKQEEDKPAYVLIDCGYKPGSNDYVGTTIGAIMANIRQATAGYIDVAVITHEHQDHVNGITVKNFEGIKIGESWFAWTENPEDDLANSLRAKFNDRLLGLLNARNRLKAAGEDEIRTRVEGFLSLELGWESEEFDAEAARAVRDDLARRSPESASSMLAASNDFAQSRNKASMKVFRDLAAPRVRYLRPHEDILQVPGSKRARVFALGPPRDSDLLNKLDPYGDEQFSAPQATPPSASPGPVTSNSPFSNRYALKWNEAFDDRHCGDFFMRYYRAESNRPDPSWRNEAPDNAPWRRLDNDWLYSTEQLALAMNTRTNNTSLVLAFEMSKGGKVLLFAADAQRGNWRSWSEKKWQDGAKPITAKDLLARTVLYKVGHHGSHNATLNGKASDDYPNLAWMAQGKYAREFTAMITAVRKWAEEKNGWDHPLKAIKDALLEKASGRVFQTDTEFSDMKPHLADPSDAQWCSFASRSEGNQLYFDYRIMDHD